VAIVFDAEAQFTAMLRDALPRSESNTMSGAFAVFVDRQGQVIACSDEHFAPGTQLELEQHYLSLKAGGSMAGVVQQDGRYYAVGARMSAGYREYKGPGDSYRNDIIALVFLPLCEAVEQAQNNQASRLPIHSDRGIDGETVEIATFHIGSTWFGLRTDGVVEAVNSTGLTSIARAGSAFAGYLMYQGVAIAVYDIAAMANTSSSRDAAKWQVIVLRRGQGSRFGILADGLGEIAEIAVSRLRPLPPMLAGDNVMGEAVVSTDTTNENQLLQVLGIERIAACLNVPGAEMPPDIFADLQRDGIEPDIDADVVTCASSA
jgi:chemotaxis signal transduction protein